MMPLSVLTSKELYFENEGYGVSVLSYLGRAQCSLSSCAPTGDKLQLLSLGPIYLLPQKP